MVYLMVKMEKVVRVEIIAYAPTVYFHCTHCEVAWHGIEATHSIHSEQMKSSLPPDLIDEYQIISVWVQELLRKHGERLTISIIDAASIEGFLKSVRHGTRKYPAVIINGRTRFVGGALREAAGEIERLIGKDYFSTVLSLDSQEGGSIEEDPKQVSQSTDSIFGYFLSREKSRLIKH